MAKYIRPAVLHTQYRVDFTGTRMDLDIACAVHDLTSRVLEERGPAGGNMHVLLDGAKVDIAAFLSSNGYADEVEGFCAEAGRADLETWAKGLVGRRMRYAVAPSGRFQGYAVDVVASYELGKRGNGAWFTMENGAKAYRKRTT